MQTQSILRWPDVKKLTGLSRSTVFRFEREGTFPRRLQLGANSVGWSAEAISAWLAARAPASPAASTKVKAQGSGISAGGVL